MIVGSILWMKVTEVSCIRDERVKEQQYLCLWKKKINRIARKAVSEIREFASADPRFVSQADERSAVAGSFLVFQLSPEIFCAKEICVKQISFWEKLCTLSSKSLDMTRKMFFDSIALNLGDLRF